MVPSPSILMSTTNISDEKRKWLRVPISIVRSAILDGALCERVQVSAMWLQNQLRTNLKIEPMADASKIIMRLKLFASRFVAV